MAISHCYCYSSYRQINWQIYPPSIEHRCLEYHYTKLGRSTPHQSNINALSTITPNLADLLPDLPPINPAEMPWVLLHQTWQIYPHQLSIDALHTVTPNLAHQSLHQLSIDALKTITPNLADLPPTWAWITGCCTEKYAISYWWGILDLVLLCMTVLGIWVSLRVV